MSAATGLDHAGIVVRDLDVARAAWSALGFALTPTARHTDADGTPTGTANACAMLRHGYIELLAVIDPARPSRTVENFLARYEGAHILSLAIGDTEAARSRLARAGLAPQAAASSRDTPDGTARFERLVLADAAPRLQLIRHLTRELVWRPEQLVHPNHAVALEEVVVTADLPAELAALLGRLAGRPLRPDPAGGYALPLAEGRLRILAPANLEAVLPGLAIPPGPFVAGVVLRTDDANAAVAALGIGRATPTGRLAMATGTAVLFIP